MSRTYRVLVADDEEGIRFSLKLHLEDAGYVVEGVADGEAALQALREKDFDFCLCDLRMPKRDGLDVLRAVTGEGLRTRILFMSAHADAATALEAIARVGGLSSATADPTGVFVFRNEPEEIANMVLGRSDLVGTQRMVYVLDLTQPNGLFLARDFVIRDGDTVYVTEAPFVQWTKAISAVTGSLGTAASLANTATNITGN